MADQDLRVGRAWDDEFRGWVDEIRLGRRLKKPPAAPKGSSQWSGAGVAARNPGPYPGYGSKTDAKARLMGIAKRSKQVMVKITGGAKSVKSMKSHFDYLSRNGELALVDQNGEPIHGRDALGDLLWTWRHTGPEIDETKERKEAFNIVFSMPEGTDPAAVHEAVKATAEHHFAGHQWVMVQHFDEPQVHCHVCVRAEGLDGQRLNPRKADLRQWRERFAFELRQRGVEAEASTRAARLQREKINTPWAVTRMQERGEPSAPQPPQQQNAARAQAARRREDTNTDYYSRIIDALRASPDPSDRELASGLTAALSQTKAQNKAVEIERSAERKPEMERG